MAEATATIEPTAPATSWTEPLKADPELAQYVDKIQEKDLITFAKSKINLEKKLGDAENRIREEFKTKGLLKTPAPEKYEIKRPDGLPEGAWNEQIESKAHEWAKKHGLSQEALNDALALHLETMAGFGEAVQVDRKAAAEKIKAQLDKDGVSVEQFDAALARFRDDPATGWDDATRELLSKSGWADHPGLNLAIYKIVKESGSFDTRNTGDSTMEGQTSAEESEVLTIMGVLNNPSHPDYAKFNTAENNQKIDAYWKKKAGGAQYVISS